MRQMLQLKAAHPLPTSGPLPDSFDLRLDCDQHCPRGDEFDEYRENHPAQGMPFGLPGLDAERLQVLGDWLDEGAPCVLPAPRSAAEQEAIATW